MLVRIHRTTATGLGDRKKESFWIPSEIGISSMMQSLLSWWTKPEISEQGRKNLEDLTQVTKPFRWLILLIGRSFAALEHIDSYLDCE